MKKLFLALFIVGSFTVQSQELKWYNDVKAASDVSIKTKKPLFFFFTGSDWCGWCMRLQKEVFQTSEFTKWANENVVLVELDFPRRKVLDPAIKQQNTELEQMFGIRGYPTVWIVNPAKTDGQVSFDRLGTTGYAAGGPNVWIEGANSILKNKK
jgi:protein disulfide-isomerase